MLSDNELEEQLEKLHIKFEFQRKYKDFSYKEKIQKIFELLPTVSDKEKIAYLELVGFLEQMSDFEKRGIDITEGIDLTEGLP